MRSGGVLGGGVALILVLGVACASRSDVSGLSGSDPSCRTASPPCPPVAAPSTLGSEINDSAGFKLEPPDSRQPLIDASEAMDLAWKEGVEATSQQAILALVPRGGSFKTDTLVWLVRYEGYCAVPIGPPRGGHNPTCYMQPYFTLINAETGEFIASWTRPP